jgi:hypothetical protein
MTENLSGACIGFDGACPDCGTSPLPIIQREKTENAGDIYISYHIYCTKCQKKVKEGVAKLEVDKYGRQRLDI